MTGRWQALVRRLRGSRKQAAAPMPAVLPVSEASFDGGTGLIMLGTDLANQAIPGAAAVVTTVAPAVVETSPNG